MRAAFKISQGEIFDTEKIRAGLDNLRNLYESEGYINFTPVPNATVNKDASTIALSIDVDEGAQFRLGHLMLDGQEVRPGAGARLLANWTPYQGKVFDPRQVEDFLAQNAAWLPPGMKLEQNVEIKQDVPARLANVLLRMPDGSAARN